MKRKELMDILTRWDKISGEYEDEFVVIHTAKGGIPCNKKVDVGAIVKGFDWERGRLIIYPTTPLVPVNNISRPVYEEGRKRLEELKQAYPFKDGKYIAKAREEEWIEGFVEGVKQHITGCK